jgi:hypothetical protein
VPWKKSAYQFACDKPLILQAKGKIGKLSIEKRIYIEAQISDKEKTS